MPISLPLEQWAGPRVWTQALDLRTRARIKSKIHKNSFSGIVTAVGHIPVLVQGDWTNTRIRNQCNVCGSTLCAHAVALLLEHAEAPPTPPVHLPTEERRVAPRAILSLGRWEVKTLTGAPKMVDGAMILFAYGPHEIASSSREQPLLRTEGEQPVAWVRDPEAETAATQRIESTGLLRLENSPVRAVERQEIALWMRFLQREAPRLREEGWEIRTSTRFAQMESQAQSWWLRLHPQVNGKHALALGITVDEQEFDLIPVLRKLLRSHSEELLEKWAESGTPFPVTLPNGRPIAIPAERLARILEPLSTLLDPRGTDDALLSSAQCLSLREMDFGDLTWHLPDDLRDLWERLKDFQGLQEVAPPTGLTIQLRPYQLQGLSWLQFLRTFGLGGILADDMGLGKTVQSLSHILLEKEAGRLCHPALVICPTSLVDNWKREARRFTPNLRVLVLHGPDRQKQFAQIPNADLVITTYPLLARDETILVSHTWSLAFFDEAHQLKNPRARAVQSARQLRCGSRIALSGTPVENHLGELWCLLDLLNPGILGSERRFRDLWRKAIEGRGDAVRCQELARRVAPFLLRRTKFQVASDLPPKTEIVKTVTFDKPQRDFYDRVRSRQYERVEEEISRVGQEKSGIVVLDALLKLRQVCCDPRLVPTTESTTPPPSAKLELLLEMLTEMLEEGRRILVFSQFTSMLALIENALRERHIGYALLTGQTKDRGQQVDRFQEGKVPVFLISLKAGGAGLNLTTADTVILYDPWWNPAAEAQAMDRAHRIGQTNPVFVYRLIAEGTVEERIALLQERKRELAQGILEGGGNDLSQLTADDLRELLSGH